MDKKDWVKIIAVDFDGTIVDHEFPGIGKLKPGAKDVLNKWHDQGIKVIIWTCRDDVDDSLGEQSTLEAVKKFLAENDIKYDTINEMSTVQPFRLSSPKVYADIYIDDRNFGGFNVGWKFIDEAVQKFYELDRDWHKVYRSMINFL